MGLEIQKRYSSYSFHPKSIKFYKNVGYYRGIHAVTFFYNQLSLKKVCHFEILTWESKGNHKMPNILKTAGCREKRMKSWDSQS